MQKPTISVIVPVYGVEKYLDRAVESIVSQSFKDLEILLIDDGSPDRCGQMCDVWAERDGRIRVIHKENGGLSDARNSGIEAATGEYLIFIDSDDFIEPAMLEVLYELIIEHKADIAACGIYNCYKEKKIPQCAELETLVLDGISAFRETLIGERSPGGIVNKLIKREIIGGHRFRLGKTYEDAFFTPRLLLGAERVAITTKPLYNYWHRVGSITTIPFSDKAMDAIEAYEYTESVIKEACPELLPLAEFRLQWAHFTVLERMLKTKNFRRLPQYQGVVKYLKKNWLKVAKSNYFRITRRISAVALKISVELYRLLMIIQDKNNRVDG